MVKNLIVIKNEVNSTSYNKDGDVIFNLIKNALQSKVQVTVSFEGIFAVNTSFINSAFIELLEFFTFEEIKSNLKFINSTKQINSIIAKRFNDETVGRELLATV